MKTVSAPFARMPEHIARLSDADKLRAAVRPGRRLGDNDTLKIFPSRAFLARMIRQEERGKPSASWRPVVRLETTEGY